MSYESKVYRILIATPSDVEEERNIIVNAIQSWNDLNSFSKKVVLLPLRWETHTAPNYGERPQEYINRTIVDDCDLLIGCFWTRIGSPTGIEESGTIEEIKRVSESGKPVMLYFSKKAKDPSTIDLEQLKKLNDFKEYVKTKALIEEYSSSIDFRDKLAKQLEIKVREIEINTKDKKIAVETSFVNINDETLMEKQVTEKILVPVIDFDEVDKSINNKQKYKEHRESIINECTDYIERISTYPIVFGMRNKSINSLTNFLIEISFNEPKDSCKICGMGRQNRSSLYYSKSNISRETMRKLNMLDSEGLVKKNNNICSFSYTDTSLQKERIKIVHPYLLVCLKKSTSITFEIKIYADNLFIPLEDKCTIKFEVENKTIKLEDIIPDIDLFIKNEEEYPF